MTENDRKLDVSEKAKLFMTSNKMNLMRVILCNILKGNSEKKDLIFVFRSFYFTFIFQRVASDCTLFTIC